jgi:hypothetical protein
MEISPHAFSRLSRFVLQTFQHDLLAHTADATSTSRPELARD